MTQKTLVEQINKPFFPLLDVFKSNGDGSYYILVSRIKPHRKIECILILIDGWKMGLKDCIVWKSMTKSQYQDLISKVQQDEIELEKISLEDAYWHIQYGLRIAQAVKTRIPKIFFQYGDILGDYSRIKVLGSLYKCYACGKGELAEQDVEIIKKVTKADMKEGVCGTEEETPIFYVCENCKKEESIVLNNEDIGTDLEGIIDEEEEEIDVTPPEKVGRNDPCPCGSGLKYKNCHLAIERQSHRISPKNLAQKDRIECQNEKDYLFYNLNFDEQLYDQIEELFNINLEGMPPNMEPMFFSTAIFQITSAEMAIAKLECLTDVDFVNEDEKGIHYIWTRAYPKGHWNPMSEMPGARQIIGDIQVNFDNTMEFETKTKGWLIGLICYMIDALGNDMRLVKLEFENPMDLMKNSD